MFVEAGLHKVISEDIQGAVPRKKVTDDCVLKIQFNSFLYFSFILQTQPSTFSLRPFINTFQI